LRTIFIRALIFLVCSSAVSNVSFAFEGLAILGDSSSTGAASHPKLEYDSKVLWSVFRGETDLSFDVALIPQEFKAAFAVHDAPSRLGPSSRENDGGSGWIWHNLIQKISAGTLEEHRFSYGYFVGRSLGLPANDILIAGENGTTTRHAWVHASRLIEARDRDLPSRVIFFYTGNDLCAGTLDDVTDAKDYGAELLKGMKYLALRGHADSHGTKIYIPGFLPVTSLLYEPSILEHKIRVHGVEMTCKEAREKLFAPKPDHQNPGLDEDPKFQLFSAFMPPSPVLICPTLFATQADDGSRQSFFANRVRAYREAQRRAVDDFNQWRGHKYPARAIDAVYIAETEDLKFTGGDVAGDCFHLAIAGQAKLATALLKQIH
jgi:hypothetical protein